MAATGENQELPRLFSRLQRAIEDEDDEGVLNITKKILDISRDDPDALHCRVVSLIHLSQFEPALQLIRSINKRRKGGEGKVFRLEEAYCLYRQEKYQDTLSVLSTLPREEVKVLELEAQVAYRQEEYQKAQRLYQQLLGLEKDKEERMANYYAASSLQADGAMETTPYVTNTMEQCFNLACSRLVSGCGQDAMELLNRADSLYRESLEEEGLTEEEIVEEMAVIEVQKGYCYHIQGLIKEAMTSYNTILKLRLDDPALIAVASNNILVLNGDKDIFDSKKKVKVLASEGNSRKLTKLQKLRILFNRCMFALHTNQLDQCRDLSTQLKAAQPNSDLSVLAGASLLHRERKLGAAVELLEGRLKGAGVQLYAYLAQLQLLQGNVARACKTLRDIPVSAGYVGVVATLASLYAGMGEVGVAIEVLEQMLEHWMNRKGVVTSDLVNLTKQVARFQLSHSRPEAASGVLERALQREDSLELRALLISAFSRTDPRKAEEASRSLPAFRSPAHVDVDGMEKTTFFRHSRRPAVDKAEVKTEVHSKEKKKKKRKPRLPKNLDPNATPDPERWLPLRERSYYRKSRRKGMAPTARGTQGTSAASANLMNQLDASKPAPTKSVEEAKDGSGKEGVASPRAKAQSQASKKKAKKKKGGKW